MRGFTVESSSRRKPRTYPKVLARIDATSPRKQKPAVDIRALVASLTEAEASEALSLLALRKKGEAKTKMRETRDLDMWVDALSQAHRSVFRAPGISDVGPGQIKATVASGQWEPVEEFMRSSGLNKLDIPGRVKTYRLLAEMLVDEAKRTSHHTGVPCSIKYVLNHSHLVGPLFDAGFPGYIEMGMAAVPIMGLTAFNLSREPS
jgi:hypothetical protein